MKLDYSPPAFVQSAAAEHQRQIIKTRTLGNPGPDLPDMRQYRKYAESQARRSEEQSKTEQLADKAKDDILDKAAQMRHLKYDVIEDADVVQVSVINSSDGTLIRKFPPDKVVNLVQKIREKKRSGCKQLDMKL